MNYEDFKALMATMGVDVDDAKLKPIHSRISDAIEKEKKLGVEKYQKKDSELMKFKTALKEKGYDSDKGSVSDFLDNLKKEVEAKGEQMNQSKSQIENLTDSVKLLTKQFEEEKSKNLAIEEKNNNMQIENKLRAEFSGKLYGLDDIIYRQINEKKVKVVNNEVVGVDGDDILPFDQYKTKLLEAKKDAVINTLNGGSGGEVDTLDKSETFELDPNMSVEDAIANMDKIKSSIGID